MEGQGCPVPSHNTACPQQCGTVPQPRPLHSTPLGWPLWPSLQQESGHSHGCHSGWACVPRACLTSRHLLGELQFDLLPNLLPLLVRPPREDVTVLQLLLAGSVPQLHRQQLLLALPGQRAWETTGAEGDSTGLREGWLDLLLPRSLPLGSGCLGPERAATQDAQLCPAGMWATGAPDVCSLLAKTMHGPHPTLAWTVHLLSQVIANPNCIFLP